MTPFAGYEDHDDCVSKNSDKDDPDAYCGSIRQAIEGKDTAWLDVRPWKNDRTFYTYINDAAPDLVGERMTLESQIRAMTESGFIDHGYLEYYHGKKTGGQAIKIGEPLGWRVREKNLEVLFGVFGPEQSAFHPWMQKTWEEIQDWGTRGTVSVDFTITEPKQWVEDGPGLVLDIPRYWLRGVGWVGPHAASPGSTVNWVSGAKGMWHRDGDKPPTATFFSAKQPRDPGAVCGNLWSNRHDDYAGSFGNGAEGRSADERPPKSWFDDCLAHVSKAVFGAERLKWGLGDAGDMAEDLAKDLVEAGLSEEQAKSLAEALTEKATKAAGKPDPSKEKPASGKKGKKGKKAEHDDDDEGGGGRKECPDGFTYDAEADDCVPKEPANMEEAMKQLSKLVKDMDARVTRTDHIMTPVLEGMLPPSEKETEGPGAKVRAELMKSLGEDVDQAVRDRVMTAIDTVFPEEPKNVDDRVKELATSVAEKVQAEHAKELETKMDELALEVEQKFKLPGRSPRGKAATGGGVPSGKDAKARAKAFMEEAAKPIRWRRG